MDPDRLLHTFRDHGTAMESHTKLADSIYFMAGKTLYVNLFIPSVLTWSQRGLTIRQDTAFPQAVRFGAIVLAGEYGTTNLSALPRLIPNSLRADPSVPLRFTGTASTGSVSLIPFFRMHGQRYTIYWQV
jgi:hypothetical protein